MVRYDQVRPYAAAPDAQVAEHAQCVLGEIAQALSTLTRQRAAEATEVAEGPAAAYARLVRDALRKAAFAHVDDIPTRLLGQAIALFGDLLEGDREYVALVQAREPHSTMLFTDRGCYHLTERSVGSFRYEDVERCIGTPQGNAWLVYVKLGGQDRQKLLLGRIHLFMAMRRLFTRIAGSNQQGG
jgi:hypothetical protein